ncbi:MAG: hypothetical protein AAFZ65_07420 [Planctomycetota bacterium]
MTLLSPCLLAFSTLVHQDAAADAHVSPKPEELQFVTFHEIETDSGPIRYRATAGTTLLETPSGEPEAEFFSISYVQQPAPLTSKRPVTFVFNGGPGSASVWLHLGLVGPKRVRVPSDAEGAGAPPYPLLDNPHTLLDVSDLVLIDPIGTGLSRIVGEGDSADHWGVDQDADSVARFIRRWVSDNARWASPKYILGESYGGIRAPLLVRELQSGFNSMALNGVILISPALDMESVDGQPSDAALATVLPTYAATAWYHDALPEPRPDDLDAFLDEVRRLPRRSMFQPSSWAATSPKSVEIRCSTRCTATPASRWSTSAGRTCAWGPTASAANCCGSVAWSWGASTRATPEPSPTPWARCRAATPWATGSPAPTSAPSTTTCRANSKWRSRAITKS